MHITDRKTARKRGAALLILLFFFIACGARTAKRDTHYLRFALIGKTNPVSPFQAVSEQVKYLFHEVNRANPVFTVHLGDIVFGGSEWMGVRRSDVSRQYVHFFRYVSLLNPILHTVKGEKDLHNNSSGLYRKFTGRKTYYSFNYGTLHFIVLDTTDSKPGHISEGQRGWLERDLATNRHATATFIFTYHPIIVNSRNYSQTGTICENAEQLHQIFQKHSVKAVFSGDSNSYCLEKRDTVTYYVTGFGGLNNGRYNKYYHYYLVDYAMGNITITAHRLTASTK